MREFIIAKWTKHNSKPFISFHWQKWASKTFHSIFLVLHFNFTRIYYLRRWGCDFCETSKIIFHKTSRRSKIINTREELGFNRLRLWPVSVPFRTTWNHPGTMTDRDLDLGWSILDLNASLLSGRVCGAPTPTNVRLWFACCRTKSSRPWSICSTPSGREGPVGVLRPAPVPGRFPADLAAATAGPWDSCPLHLSEPQPVSLVQQLREPGRADPGQEEPAGLWESIQNLQHHVVWKQKPRPEQPELRVRL